MAVKPRTLRAIVANGAVAVLTAVTLIPLVWMVTVSFMPRGDCATGGACQVGEGGGARPTVGGFRFLRYRAAEQLAEQGGSSWHSGAAGAADRSAHD